MKTFNNLVHSFKNIIFCLISFVITIPSFYVFGWDHYVQRYICGEMSLDVEHNSNLQNVFNDPFYNVGYKTLLIVHYIVIFACLVLALVTIFKKNNKILIVISDFINLIMSLLLIFVTPHIAIFVGLLFVINVIITISMYYSELSSNKIKNKINYSRNIFCIILSLIFILNIPLRGRWDYLIKINATQNLVLNMTALIFTCILFAYSFVLLFTQFKNKFLNSLIYIFAAIPTTFYLIDCINGNAQKVEIIYASLLLGLFIFISLIFIILNNKNHILKLFNKEKTNKN